MFGSSSLGSIQEVQYNTQLCFQDQIEGLDHLTSYSWRRLQPTVGHILKFTDASMAALGDWQDKSKQPVVSGMALHYSSAKYIASLKSKAAALGAIPALQAYESWEVIPESALETADASAKLSIQQAMNRDGHVLWAMPTSLAETSSKFALRNLLKCGGRWCSSRQVHAGSYWQQANLGLSKRWEGTLRCLSNRAVPTRCYLLRCPSSLCDSFSLWPRLWRQSPRG